MKGSLFHTESLRGTKNGLISRIPDAKNYMWTPVHSLNRPQNRIASERRQCCVSGGTRKESSTMNFCNQVKWATLPTTNDKFEPCFDRKTTGMGQGHGKVILLHYNAPCHTTKVPKETINALR